MKKKYLGKLVCGIGLGILVGFGGVAFSSEASAADMYRLYNPNSGEHFYTANLTEKNNVQRAGWRYEGIGWNAPSSGNPVYRLYNPNAGDHHYTLNANERDNLKRHGWRYEGVSWYSPGSGKPLYRLYNPNAKAGSHHYTLNANERDHLKRAGWRYEGIAWYAVDGNSTNGNNGGGTVTPPTTPSTPTAIDKIGNSGILEKSLATAGKKADDMRKDTTSNFYSGWFVVNEGSTDKVWAFASREVRMSNGETWYTIDFYVDYVK